MQLAEYKRRSFIRETDPDESDANDERDRLGPFGLPKTHEHSYSFLPEIKGRLDLSAERVLETSPSAKRIKPSKFKNLNSTITISASKSKRTVENALKKVKINSQRQSQVEFAKANNYESQPATL